MKTSLPYLPPENQSEILQIAEVIKEVIYPEKMILFGSYAKGDQVDDTYFENGVRYQYISDYDGKLKLSAFMLHQAAGNFYNTMLLVFTGYKPKTHNLDKLRQYAKHISEELFAIFPFPTENDEEKHLFDILKRGYIDARYKEDFIPTSGDNEKLSAKLILMKEVVNELCEKKLVNLYNQD